MHYSPTFGGIDENLPTYTAKDGSSKTEEEWGNVVLSKVNFIDYQKVNEYNISISFSDRCFEAESIL